MAKLHTQGVTPEEGEWVDRGEFKLDRAKALETLQRYRLADPDEFVLALVRSAVLKGASEMGFLPLSGGFEATWNGRPYAAAFLKDPLSALVGSETDTASRFLAVALLGATQAGARVRLRVNAGRDKSHELEWRSPEDFSFGSGIAGIRTSTMDVEWSRRRSSRALSLLRAACRWVPLDLWIDSHPIERSAGYVRLSRGGTAVQASPREDAGRLSRLDVCVHGVIAGSAELEGAFGAVEGALACDALSLDASMSSAVRNERFQQALEEARAALGDLAGRLAAEQAAQAPAVARYLTDSVNVSYWDGSPPQEGWSWADFTRWAVAKVRGYGKTRRRLGLGAPGDGRAAVAAAGRRTRWLRRAALAGDSPTLRKAPLFLTWEARWWSLADLEAAARADGLRASKRPPDRDSDTTIRLISPRDLADLRALAPAGSVRAL